MATESTRTPQNPRYKKKKFSTHVWLTASGCRTECAVRLEPRAPSAQGASACLSSGLFLEVSKPVRRGGVVWRLCLAWAPVPLGVWGANWFSSETKKQLPHRGDRAGSQTLGTSVSDLGKQPQVHKHVGFSCQEQHGLPVFRTV